MNDQQYAEFLANRVVDDANDLELAAALLRNGISDSSLIECEDRLNAVVARAESAISQAKEAVRRKRSSLSSDITDARQQENDIG